MTIKVTKAQAISILIRYSEDKRINSSLEFPCEIADAIASMLLNKSISNKIRALLDEMER